MKVLHIGHTRMLKDHPDYQKVSDHPGRWVLNHALAQHTLPDMEVEILMHVPGASQDWEGQVNGVKIHCLKAPDRFRAASLFYFDARRLVKKIKEIAPDIVHAHGTEDAYALAAQRSGYPYLLTAQGMYFMINEQVPPPLLSRKRVVEWTERMFMKSCRHVIAKSEYVKNAIHRKFPHTECHLIPNTFDPAILDYEITKNDPCHLAFVGIVDYRKGVHLIADALEALQENKNIVLSIIGNGGDFNTQYENEQIGRLRAVLGDRLVLHGHVDAAEVYRIVAGASILLAPSLEEMFGNQLIEALLLGTSGIVSSGTALAENVQKFGNGTIFENGSGADLARAISKNLQCPASDDTRLRARERVVQALGSQHVAEQHRELYHLIKSSGGSQ